MLLQFCVSNYASFKEEATLSLVPSSDKEHPENIITNGKNKANAIIAIYGANAAGKSALFKAMTSAILFIRNSSMYQVDYTIPVVPFKFCEKPEERPTKVEFTFIAEDGKKYIYGFSATTKEVSEEYLYCYNSAKPSMIFERTKEEYKFSRTDSTVLTPLKKMNTSNKLFLATATQWNAAVTAIPFKWFSEKINTQTSIETLKVEALEEYRTNSEENIEFFKKLCYQVDITISNVEFEAKEVEEQNRPGFIINNQVIKPSKQYEAKITTEHLIKDDAGNEVVYQLGMNEESTGTSQLFYFAPILRKVLAGGKTLVIDEFDRSLHPYIVRFLVNVFRNPLLNSNGAQLIITTHETTLLSLSIFRRDEIYFVEKNAQTGVSELYSLDEYPVRKDDNIEKGYLLGRYGAIPFLQTEDIL